MAKTAGPALTALALTMLTACDYAQRQEYRAERSEAAYQKAMEAYEAGQIDLAVREFGAVVRANPANASARFQLGCLLMESKKDYLGAICCFREYMQQEPASDKAELAEKRFLLCEKMLAKELAAKMNLTDNASVVEEAERVRTALSAAEKRSAELSGDVDALKARNAELEKENARLRRMVSSIGEEEPSGRLDVAEAKKLLDEEDEGDRLKLSPDAKALFLDAEEGEAPKTAAAAEGGEAGGGSDLIAAHTSGRATGPKFVDLAKKTAASAPEPPHETRPETYTVEEGDTLYRIATRFYGRVSAWKQIREANKAVISTDGRIKVGQKLVLP